VDGFERERIGRVFPVRDGTRRGFGRGASGSWILVTGFDPADCGAIVRLMDW